MFRSFVVLALMGALGCNADVPPPTQSAGTGNATGSKGGSVGSSGTAGTTGSISIMVGVAGSNGTGNTTGTAGTTGAAGIGGPVGTDAYSDLPCNVGSILKANCSMCHGQTPAFGAPMSLIHASDFSKKGFKDSTQTIAQAVVARISDNQTPMPQPPNPRLSATDNATLTAWAQAGAKAGACTSVTGGGGTRGGETGNPNVVDPPDPKGDGITCYDIKARDSSGNKFSVPTTPDLYHCFHYAPPWGSQKVHLISWKPLIDNKQVIHHWLLYNESTAVTDKTDVDCVGAHPSAQLTAGWAPGGQGHILPDDVGQDVSGAGFTLETHYNNTTGAASPDGSGIHMCVTTNLRQNEAGVHWLGTEVILLPVGGDAVGTCIPKGPAPIHILQSIPHMHLQGSHMKTIINRADGTKDTLIDQPFDFNTQIGYSTPALVNTGDTLTTTCTYKGPATYGEGTKSEMCYNFVLAYPNGALSSGSFLRKNGCTGL